MGPIRIGLIADVQYADIDDVWNYMRTHKRKYRSTLIALANAITWWSETDILDLVVDLGDAIDGYRNTDRAMGLHALRNVVREWHRLKTAKPEVPILHLIGNHELYKFTREELTHGLAGTDFQCSCPPQLKHLSDRQESIYYSFPLRDNWRVVVLDPYDMSVMTRGGGRIGHELTLSNGGIHAEYAALCQSHNPNNILDGGNFFNGISGTDARWVPFNGGLGESQLKWFRAVLESSTRANERLIVFSHIILHPRATPKEDSHTLLWNYEQVLDVISEYDCVKIVIAGHAHHDGYYRCPESNVHHITLASPLEAPDELVESTYGLLELPSDAHGVARLIGKGWVRSIDLDV